MATERADDDPGAAALVFGVLALLYWALRCPTFGPGDSPQHVLSAVTWGVSVAPGYPLYVALGHLLSLLPIGAPAANVNGLSGLCQAGAAAGLFLLLRRQGVPRVAALTAAALMALSRLYWYYAEVAEVRGLNDLLAVWTAVFLFSWTERRRRSTFLALAACLGLGLSHHPTFVLILPAAAFLLWSRRTPAREVAALGALSAAFCAAPYLMLWIRLHAGEPVWNPGETRTLHQIWDLFTRKGLGGPFRMVTGRGVFGFQSFDAERFWQHLRWFLSACLTDLTPAGLVLAALGGGFLLHGNRTAFAFWSLWIASSALVFIGVSSQQLILCDAEYVRGMAMRFYLLPYIGLFALAGAGLGRLLARVRQALGLAFLAAAVCLPLSLRRIDLRAHNTLMEYCRLMVKETGPSDMLILGPDDTILGMSYLELAERSTGERVLLVPSLFGFPPYIRSLHRLHPSLAIPPLDGHDLTTDWAQWLKANPGRRLFAEASLRDTLTKAYPATYPDGVLARVLLKPERAWPHADAERFLAEVPQSLITRAGVFDFTQEVYLLKDYQVLLEWYGSQLPSDDKMLAARLRARLEAL